MVQQRVLAIPDPAAAIQDLSEETKNIIRSDLRQYARENSYRLTWDKKTNDYADMSGRFCDIEKIYQNTNLTFCKPGEDIEPFEMSMERHIAMHLYSDDVEALCNKAALGGLTVAELLENFVADLIHGAKTNGSDERMYANKWFERCWFGMDFGTSFLKFASEWSSIDEILRLWEDIQYYQSLDELDEYDKDEMQEIKEELDDYFAEYQEWVSNPLDNTLEEGMKKLVIWDEERKLLLNGEQK